MARYVILLCALWAVATAHAHLRFDLSGTVLDARMPELELQFGVQNL